MKGGTLEIDLKGYWHAGGGRGAGMVLDAVVHKDTRGLPVLPGRHIKGLLRDACQRAENWGWEGFEGLTERLFGQALSPGCLRVTDGRLPREITDWLGNDARKHLRAQLFRKVYATAIDHDSGTAEDHSLRGIEVTIPLTLAATIAPLPGTRPPQDWKKKLEAVFPLIDAVGAHRSRGLGRVVMQWRELEP